jgi:hypothetical protein
VNLDAVAREPVLGVPDHFEIRFEGKEHMHPADPDLLQEEKLVVSFPSLYLGGDFGVVRIVLANARGSAGYKWRCGYGLSRGRSQRKR